MRDRIVVIDDDEDFRFLVRLLLEAQGLTVSEAADCEAGCALVRSERNGLHAILVDYFMPGMPPPACVSALKREAGPDVEVILVTAAADAAQRAREVGCERWLSKPFTPEQLRRALATEARQNA